MPTELEKIESSAARRLTLPAGVSPREKLESYKEFLRIESARLRILHRGGAGGAEACRLRSAMMDAMFRHLAESILALEPNRQNLPRIALVAYGGYGRSELSPYSDVDLLFLHDGTVRKGSREHPWVQVLIGGGMLWDFGLKVGHMTFSIDEAVRHANKDMQSKTSFIEARLVTGDAELFAKFQAAVLAKCVRGHEDSYIDERLKDQESRHAKHGNSACMVEPNIKNGCGGLRDFQSLVWMAFFKYKTRSLRDLEARDLISGTERRQLEKAYDFLLRVRNELHFFLSKPVDILHKNVQPMMATNLGYSNRSPSVRIEMFVGDVYTHMRNIYLITRTLERRLALLPLPSRLPTFRQFLQQRKERAQYPVDGFKFIDGEIYPASTRVFKDQPRRLMRVFLHAQQRGLVLHPNVAQMIRHELPAVGREFLKDTHVHQTFLEILNQRGGVARIMREMHDVGFLGKYLPEFGKITCRVQHEFYHQYAVDEHTLMCLTKLDHVWHSSDPADVRYLEVFRSLERPFILYLALLLHDAGKSSGGGRHEIEGSKLGLKVARRLGLDGSTTHSLQLLIEQHLLMAQVSQKRDLDDEEEIRQFAMQIQTPDNLAMLLLLTRSDSLATSDQLWNGFKDSLLWTLYSKAMVILGGGTDFTMTESRQRELLMEEIRGLVPQSFREDELTAHFEGLPPRYFRVNDTRQILNDLVLAHRFMHLQLDARDRALEPIVHWHNEPDRGYTVVHVCTWDRAGLFAKVTGSMTAAGLNILGAKVFTRADSIVLDTFYVVDAVKGLLVGKDEREQFEEILGKVLNAQEDEASDVAAENWLQGLIRKREGNKAPNLMHGQEPFPTTVEIDNNASQNRTVIEVNAEDRMGLLYTISRSLSRLGLNLSVAKISTEKGAASDVFYVTTREGQKLEDARDLKRAKDDLKRSIDRLARDR